MKQKESAGPNERPCPLCDGTRHERVLRDLRDFEYRAPSRHDLIGCAGCGLIRTHPEPTSEDLKNAYPSDYHGYHVATAGGSMIFRFLQNMRIRKRVKEVVNLIGTSGSILDVGCADGYYLDLLKPHGRWDLWGIEFKDDIAQRGREKGLRILTGELGAVELKNDFFALVVMNHLLEHVSDPIETLREARRVLKPGGVLVGELPNIRCWDFNWFGAFWGGLHIPRHLFHFSPRTLRQTLERGGFTDIRIFSDLNTSHWALSVQNFHQSFGGMGRHLTHGRTWYYNLLLPLFVPINALAKLFDRTGIIRFQAKKP